MKMLFELFCATLIALLFGLVVTFRGYRLFVALLPLWGFFFGFGLGAQTMQALFGQGFLATSTSWVVGFLIGAIFAGLSYMFYNFAVAILAGSLGYFVGISLMLWIFPNLELVAWIVGIVLSIILLVVTLRFNLQKYAIVAGTSIIGAGLVIGTLMLGVVGVSIVKFFENPIQLMLHDSPIWAILFLVLAVGGIVFQLKVKPAPELAKDSPTGSI
jgi:Domain of unknown function (DUF4203)